MGCINAADSAVGYGDAEGWIEGNDMGCINIADSAVGYGDAEGPIDGSDVGCIWPLSILDRELYLNQSS